MDDEVEDIVGEVKYTNSQKSVTTSNVYSLDFTDSSSDKNQSSGKETYLIELTDSDSDKTYYFNSEESITNLTDNTNKISEHKLNNKVNRAASTSLKLCAAAENIFTQTSKTVCQVTNEVSIQNNAELKNLETQTSFTYVTEKSTVNYAIRVEENPKSPINGNIHCSLESNKPKNSTPHKAVEEKHSDDKILSIKESQTSAIEDVHNISNCAINSVELTNYESKDVSSELYNETLDRSTDGVDTWSVISDFEEDSLNDNESRRSEINLDTPSEISDSPDSVENDLQQLYNQISANTRRLSPAAVLDSGICNVTVLTPVTEETNKNESIFDVTPSADSLAQNNYDLESHELNQRNIKLKTSMTRNKIEDDRKELKLPPIFRNISYPKSPLVDDLFFIHTPGFQFQKSDALPSVFRDQQMILDRWEYGCNNLASGESAFINNNDIKEDSNRTHLPQVPIDGCTNKYRADKINNCNGEECNKDKCVDEISINEKIRHLKMSNLKTRSKLKSGSSTPKSGSTPCETQLCDAAEKGCDALCFDIMRRLRSCNWIEVTDTLEYLPQALDSFWPVIAENRIADMLRQLAALVESPRTQVARKACDAIAQMLKNTNYTKKPDFYEAIAILLTKTSSYNRVVRRAANISLDEIVCSVDLIHSVTAICVYGVEHKSPRVRCASSRLLIVCCALGEGGRQLLRSRPPTAAAARRHVLRALALLLMDKNFETRKYAERLYVMLRALPNFEAYFLTDVDVELASQHMKKYDFVLKKTNSR